jgi:hypothetical protein
VEKRLQTVETTRGVCTAKEVYQWLKQQLCEGPSVSPQRNVLDVAYLAEILAYTTDFDPWVAGCDYSTNGVIRYACRQLVREGVLKREGYNRYRRVNVSLYPAR